MNVLVDTSVWIEHFRNGSPSLVALILEDRVLTHPMVILELACGAPLEPRAQTLADIGLLQSSNLANFDEVMILIEREKLYGNGCGLVDISLLCSTLITSNAYLWTLDKKLLAMAQRFGIDFQPVTH